MDFLSICILVSNFLLIPLLLCTAMGRLLRSFPRSLGGRLCYYGWNYVLSIFFAKELRQIMEVIFQKEISPESLQCSLCVLLCAAAVGFFTAVVVKNISVSVEYRNEA